MRFPTLPVSLIVLAGCGGGSGRSGSSTAPTPATTPTPSSSVTITGTVTDRIDGGPAAEGSTVTYTAAMAPAAVFTGTYQVQDNADASIVEQLTETVIAPDGSSHDRILRSTKTPKGTAITREGYWGELAPGASCYLGAAAQPAALSTAAASAIIVNGAYRIENITQGAYRVDITGTDHVTHTTLRVDVTPSNLVIPFSVKKWGSGSRFGVVYDAAFDQFFNLFARINTFAGTDYVVKWATPPREVYVTQEGLSPAGFNRFMRLHNDVNNENTQDEYCALTGPLAINTGPVIGDRRDGSIVYRFAEGGNSTTLYIANSIIAGAKINHRISLIETHPEDRSVKGIIGHERSHAASDNHTDGMYDRYTTIMNPNGSVANYSPFDRLAQCIIYHGDTKPGNKYPDINPTR